MRDLIIGEYGKFVYVTYLGGLFALAAMYYFIQGQVAFGMMCFIVSGICDLFDGRVANSFERNAYQKRYGIEIDSLCDMVSFAAVPTVLIFTQLADTIWSIPLAGIYVLAAISRLATFNAQAKMQEEEEAAYFIGVPVTYSALVFPVSFIMVENFWPGNYHIVLPVFAFLLAYLFVMKRQVPKPRGKAYVFFCLLALISLVALWGLANG